MRMKTWTGVGCFVMLAALLVSTACSEEPTPNSPGAAGAAGVPNAGSEGGEAGSGSGAGGAAGAAAGETDPGPKRNCGYTYAGQLSSCTPGTTVQLTCHSPSGVAPQALRICEGSSVLGAAVACADSDALTTALPTSEGMKVSFRCPEARDEHEPGGQYGLYYGAIWPEDETRFVTCVAD